MPILALIGDYSTGKSSIMKVLVQLVFNPVPTPDLTTMENFNNWVGLKGDDSYSELRDKLGVTTTAFIEEADDLGGKQERLIANRYSRQMAVSRLKFSTVPSVWQPSEKFYFGTTVLHKRKGFKNPATRSRAIVINTRLGQGIYLTTYFSEDERIRIRSIAHNIDISRDIQAQIQATRGFDIWFHLHAIAGELQDRDWQTYASEQIEREIEVSRQGQVYEANNAVILVVINKAIIAGSDGYSFTENQRIRTADIKDIANCESGLELSTYEVDQILCRYFPISISHGQMKVTITREGLLRATQKLGIQDESLSAQ